MAYAERQYQAIIADAEVATSFGHSLSSNDKLIKLCVSFIKILGFTVMCKIGDFSVFKSPWQLFAYFGLDPCREQCA
jgi:hypothetical protein